MKGVQKALQVEVGKYVLPKFQVKIKPPSYVARGQKQISFSICAKYSYGKDVIGTLTAKYCLLRSFYYYENERKGKCVEVTRKWVSAGPLIGKSFCTSFCQFNSIQQVFRRRWKKYPIKQQISGCSPFNIDSKDVDLNARSYYYSTFFVIDAQVNENATGITLNATQTSTGFSSTAISLSFDGTLDVFKPGLPFKAVLKATRPDNTPVKKLDVDVEVHVSYSKLLLKEKVKVRNGVAKINVSSIPFDAPNIRFEAVYLRDPLFKGEDEWQRRTSAYKTVQPWYSPSHSYLSIEKPTETLKIESEASINVHYTSVDVKPTKRRVFYSLMCKGYITHSGSLDAEFIAALVKKEKPIQDAKPERKRSSGIDELPSSRPILGGGKKRQRRESEILDTPPSSPKPTTAAEPTPISDPGPEEEATIPAPTSAPTPAPTDRIINPWERQWVEPTRPPLPPHFSSGSFKISFKVTQQMSPSCRMIVYYIRGKETVADSTELDTEDVFANKVSMNFDQNEVEPGSETKLILSATPGSRFAIVAVDKSVHFLRKGNDLRPAQLVNIFKGWDIGPTYIDDWGRCDHSWYGRRKRRFIFPYGGSDMVDSQKAFNDAGLAVLSNVVIDSRPCTGPQVASLVVNSWGGVGGGDRVDERPQPLPKSTGKTGNTGNTGNTGKTVDKPEVRTEFPETWLWSEENVNEKTGRTTVAIKVPDTITTWYASGFAVSDSTGLGIASPAELRAFRPFFVSLTLPYSVIRGEDVTVPAAVFNYLSKCLTVRVTLEKSEEYHQMIAGQSVKVCLCGSRTATVLFCIKPRKLGHIGVQVKAESLPENVCKSWQEFESNVTAIDIVRRKLLVEAEGIENDYNYNSLICPKDNENGFSDKIKLTLPKYVVPGSVYSKITAIGDLMGPSLSGISDLLRMPYGCGEQNMLNFAPNIFIMQYLNATFQLTSEIQEKAENYMRSGYQRELTYKHSDGGYSAFGERDNEASMWLTAFVLKSFAQARPFIDIDDQVFRDAKRWIFMHQSPDGCFPTVGLLHSKLMKGGVSTPVTLTGYVIISLLEADENPTNSRNLSKALDCVEPYLKDINNSYSAAILAYAMAKAGRPKELKILLDKLDKFAIKQDGLIHWEAPREKPKKNPNRWNSPYYTAPSADIEMTSYALLAYIASKDKKDAVISSVPIVRWLSQQRNSLGGWASTQDTVLAMQALSDYASLAYGGNINLTISVANKNFQKDFKITEDNSLVLQRVEIPQVPTIIKVSATGEGCALLQVSMKYNVKEVQEEPAFAIDVKVNPIKGNKKLLHGRCLKQQMKVCARWLKEDESNMAIISVRMVSGFVATPDSLDKAINRYPFLKEHEMEDNKLNLYFNKITKNRVCVKFQLKQANIVQNRKPAPVKVYDYYDNELSATATYEITENMCKGNQHF